MIINEFGEVGWNCVLVADQSDDRDIQLPDSGCLLLEPAARSRIRWPRYHRRLRGEIPLFDRVLIETSAGCRAQTTINAVYDDVSWRASSVSPASSPLFDAGFRPGRCPGVCRSEDATVDVSTPWCWTCSDLHPEARTGRMAGRAEPDCPSTKTACLTIRWRACCRMKRRTKTKGFIPTVTRHGMATH